MDFSLDVKGIKINGEYKILLCSSFFYFRIPRERWDSRMKLLKAAGYNSIDVYCPWNYHEIEEGAWDFEEQRDLTSFLQLANDNGLYVIVRPGPYICSEWDNGALPSYLNAKNIDVRQDDDRFLEKIFSWYDHVLPIIKPFQITENGSVVLMQVENELDFYACKSPITYIGKLRSYVRDSGIEIPLFCCCGQNNVERAGSLDPCLDITYNVYSDHYDSALEDRLRELYRTVSSKNKPLLVTETNRQHSYLKRLFAFGAKLISPYNQTAGTTSEYYNGLTNWGNPTALMSSDYDFESMIGSAGDVTEEFYQARAFSIMLGMLSSEGASGVPGILPNCIDIKKQKPLPSLKMESGNIILIANYEKKDRYIDIAVDEHILKVFLSQGDSKLLPVDYLLNDNIRIIYSNSELIYADEYEGKPRLYFAGEGKLDARISCKDEAFDLDLESGEFFFGGFSIVFKDLKTLVSGSLGNLVGLKKKIGEQVSCVSLSEYVEYEVEEVYENQKETRIVPMEKLGQLRGVSSYKFNSSREGEVLIQKPADIIIKRHEGRTEKIWYAEGASEIDYIKEGETEFITEIWGHSNFNDIRRPSLQMNSLKGIAGISFIDRRVDISSNWEFDFNRENDSDNLFFPPSPYHAIIDIDGYICSNRPFDALYHKWIDLSEFIDKTNNKYFLYFSEGDAVITIYANGKKCGKLDESEHYFDITDFKGNSSFIDLVLRIERIDFSHKVGAVELIIGTPIEKCCYCEYKKRKGREYQTIKGPIKLDFGKQIVIKPVFPDDLSNDLKLVFKGKNLKIDIYHGKKCIGRCLVDNSQFPPIKGGVGNMIMLCREWIEDMDGIELHLLSIGPNSQLNEIELRNISPLV